MGLQKWLVPVVLAAVMCLPLSAGAQALTPADAKPFLGKWTMAAEGPMGPLTLELTVSDNAGKIEAEVGGDPLPMTKVTDITKVGTDLVLKYTIDVQGMSLPAKLTLTPTGDTLKTNLEIADGAFSMPGTAKKAA